MLVWQQAVQSSSTTMTILYHQKIICVFYHHEFFALFHQVLSIEVEGNEDNQLRTPTSQVNQPQLLRKIHCRLKNYEPVTPLKNLKANYYGMSVSIVIITRLTRAVQQVYFISVLKLDICIVLFQRYNIQDGLL